MTTKPKARKFRVRRVSGLSLAPSDKGGAEGEAGQAATATQQAEMPATEPAAKPTPSNAPAASPEAPVPAEPSGHAAAIAAIRKEGLTGRQLRMARRVAQRHGLAATSDFDAVRLLREKGIDPFQRANILELVVPEGAQAEDAAAEGAAASADPQRSPGLPATLPQKQANLAPQLPSTDVDAGARRAFEIREIQADIARRRRRKLALLFVRLAFFVLLPTFAAGYYYYSVATPMYATKSEFVIQQAESQGGAAGLGGLFQGTSMATQQDSITVQSYLTSRAAMVRLDEDLGFKEHFSDPDIDPIQRLAPDASNEEAFAVYQNRVQIGYDPTEGLVRMEVIAADPQLSEQFSQALIGYAEEQVDNLTQRLREDQMSGARESFEQAEIARSEALARLLTIQEEIQTIDPATETGALINQISTLEIQLQEKRLQLQALLDNLRPNAARVAGVEADIGRLEGAIADLRSRMTDNTVGGTSLAAKNAELRVAEADFQTRDLMLQQALQQMETARIEANRQVRYLSLGVEPVAPDEATHPKAFENTVLAFLIFSGIYLMISLTASILREQVSS